MSNRRKRRGRKTSHHVKHRGSHKLNLYNISFNKLNKYQKVRREKAYTVLRDMRHKGYSYSYACSVEKINRRTAERYLRTAIYRKHGRILAKPFDTLPREMQVNSAGRSFFIELRGSRSASRMGAYHNAVRDYIYDGKLEMLNTYRNEGITDSSGTFYPFETDTKKLLEIYERKESESYEVYKGG